ncbi:MAG TPA: 23S rRNA (adenine(2503)-C(2))-methyltransferase RlmN [Alphaproteobacteria bacterium]|nr:23S rRNA (adenine(2503)-C(2))-methyltransferase RlmN [Alphaproteobacteria bacterium]
MSTTVLATAQRPEPVKTELPAPAYADGRRDLIGLTREELACVLAELDEPAFRARQLWRWIYVRGARDFAAMTDLAKSLRAKLEARFVVARPEVTRRQVSIDGTQKWLLRFADGQEIECVHIPEDDRGTLCVSSQVGCTLSCKFCHTGTQRLVRNLQPAEIVGQVMSCRDAFAEWPAPADDRRLTNIVMMGMGEPLFNFDNVATALRIVMDSEGLAVSRRKITLSTAGVAPMIRRCGAELGVMLAVSLHAVTDELRDVIVPLNKKYPIAELLAACREYPGLSNARRITFEYVMLDGVNDSPAEARALVKLLSGIPAKINLIPFNPWPGAPFECSGDKAISAFAAVLMKAGYVAPVRRPRGRDIFAACGQLKSASERGARGKAKLAAVAPS